VKMPLRSHVRTSGLPMANDLWQYRSVASSFPNV